MTGHGSLYVAEQAWTCVSPAVASRLLEVDSPTWLLPFVRLAGGDGEEAGTRFLLVRGRVRPWNQGTPCTRLEEVEVGDRVTRSADGEARRLLLWRTAGFSALFRRLEGDLSSAPRAGGTVLSLEGCFDHPTSLESLPNGELAGRRAAETAVRSLLGHLRSALEHPAAEELLA